MKDRPSTGDVYWCEAFPGLHGHAPKARYAIVISPKDRLPKDDQGEYLVVPTSSSTLSTFAVKLPNRATHPETTSGLPDVCSAVCDEYKLVKADFLTRRVGDLRTPVVANLQKVVRAVIEERKSSP